MRPSFPPASPWGRGAVSISRGSRRRIRQADPPAWAAGGDPYLSLTALSAYSGLSSRSLRAFLQHPRLPIPHYRPGAAPDQQGRNGKRGTKVLVRRSEFDKWMAIWRSQGPAAPPRDLDSIVEQAVAEVRR